MSQEGARGDAQLENQPSVLLKKVTHLKQRLPIQGFLPDTLRSIDWEPSQVEEIPSFVLESKMVRGDVYPYKRSLSLSFGLPEWCTTSTLSSVVLDAYLAVPFEEIAEIQADDPSAWIVQFDAGKWGSLIPIAVKFVQGAASGNPHRWYFTAALALVAAARVKTWPVTLTVKFPTKRLLDVNLNSLVAVQANGTTVGVSESFV